MDINTAFADLDAEALAAYLTEVQAARQAAIDALSDDSSEEDIAAAEEIDAHFDAVTAEVTAREEAAAARVARAAALRSKFSSTEPEPEDDEEDEPAEEPEVDEPEAEVEEPAAEAAAETVTASAKSTKVASVADIAKKVKRPVSPKDSANGTISITAAADSGFAAGAVLDMTKVGEALVNRVKGFAPPQGDGQSEDIRKFPVASFKIPFPDDLTVKSPDNAQEVLSYAGNESRLDEGSLVAAGGWCAPSETLYDLCAGETLDGLLSIPEVNVARGGINFTKGPDFSDLYGGTGFFTQTEAQAIAGTTKPCATIDCPDFTDVRLDATGLCIKVPILTNSAYPELINRITSGSLVAFEHKKNADTIARMVTIAGAARVIAGLGSTAQDTLAGLVLLADEKREQYRLGLNETLEVVVPFWVKGAIKNDLRVRTGQQSPVTDQQVNAEFTAHNLNVQFVYDWQPIGQTAEVYPATYNALMYPAGTYVRGTSDIINLSAVYDAASLAVNTYTGTFMEQGILVANLCYTPDLVTLPICNAGRTGAANLTCA